MYDSREALLNFGKPKKKTVMNQKPNIVMNQIRLLSRFVLSLRSAQTAPMTPHWLSLR